MAEGSLAPEVTAHIKPPKVDIPAQVEKKEPREAKKPVDLLIVLGQGPVKPLLREQDLDPQMRERWEKFKSDPLHNTEPDYFRVLEGKYYLNQLEGLDEAQIQAKLAEWQKLGRFGLNRWGRQNALAAGFALVSGSAEKVLLSGGKTIPGWAKDKLPPERLAAWRSEAELMADIIKRRFGTIYQKIYGKPIEGAIILEDSSTNTLENFGNSMNSDQGQEILDSMKRAGVLAADFHVPRGEDIAMLFGPSVDFEHGYSAQAILAQRADLLNKQTYKKIVDWMTDPGNQDLQDRKLGERRWSSGLNDPEYLTYWLGYVGIVEDPRVLQHTITRLNSDPWRAQALKAFREAGLDFESLSTTDLTKMDPKNFKEVAAKLKEWFTLKENRAMPPVPEPEPRQTQFHIVRHIPTVWNRERRIQGNIDVDIDPNAIDQWFDTVNLGSFVKPDVIVVSALKRTRQTADIIVDKMRWGGIKIVTVPELNERKWGVLEGKTHDEVRRELFAQDPEIQSTEDLSQKLNSPGFRVEGAETPEEVAQRSIKAIVDIDKRFPGKNVLVVSHGGVMSFLGFETDKLNNFTLAQVYGVQTD